jgi:hypothetical protein
MTTRSASPRRRRALSTAVVGLVLGLVLVAVELWQGAPVWSAVLGFVIVAAYVAVLVVFQARSETISTLAGNPVDERWGLIHSRAMEVAATIGAAVAVIGFVATEAVGQDNWQFAVMAVVIGLGYLGGVVWYRRRL